MRATKNDMILHFIIGGIVTVLAFLFFFIQVNFKAKPITIAFGGHFSVCGLVAAIVAAAFLIISVFGVVVYENEKKNDLRA